MKNQKNVTKALDALKKQALKDHEKALIKGGNPIGKTWGMHDGDDDGGTLSDPD